MIKNFTNEIVTRQKNSLLPLPNTQVMLETISTAGGTYEVFANSPFTELTYVIPRSGGWRPAKCYFDIGDNPTRISDLGPLVLRPCGVPLRAFTDSETKGVAQVLMFRFDDNYFSDSTGLKEWTENELSHCNNLQSKIIAQMMQRVALELITPQFGSTCAIESLLQLILIEIARIFSQKKYNTISTGQRKIAPWQLRKIEECLRETTDHWPTLNELAQLCGISPKHLSRAFSETMDTPLSKYSEQIRVERAKALLRDSKLAVKQVAATLGFPNANYFSTAFHRATGETPTSFIRSL